MTTTDYRLIDSTLRDGSHAISHQYYAEDVIKIVSGLDRAGVQVIEIAHGDGLGGSSFNYGFSAVPEKELIAKACETTQNAQIACLMLPGIGLADDLREVNELGVSVARIAVHCTEADITEQHIKVAKDLGMEAIGFLMMAHMNSPEGLVEQALLMQSYGADTIYIADSAGAMTVDDVRRRVNALVTALDIPLGVHAHNNLSTEILAAVSTKYGIETGVDPLVLMDVAEEVVRPIMPRQQVIDRAGLLLGYAGVYGSFLLHAERAADRYGVPVSEILLELGRRQVVGGQEDMIIDVALELARKHAEAEVTA
jgi:4-hydroxy 2-oxovalerate aldolase